MTTGIASGLAAIALAMGGVVVGCGGDSDEQGSVDRAKQQQPPVQEAGVARAAERLETYLKRNTKHLAGPGVQRGQVVDFVQATDGGKLKIWTRVNGDIQGSDVPARRVCRLVRASGVPEAKGAIVVDPGDALLQRC